jgi:hypothetical protein
MLNCGRIESIRRRANDYRAARIVHRLPGIDRLGDRDHDLLLKAADPQAALKGAARWRPLHSPSSPMLHDQITRDDGC